MAKLHSPTPSTPSDELRIVNHIYQLNPSVTRGEIQSELDTKLAHLATMLYIISGEGLEIFMERHDEVKSNYLWACATLAEECRQLRCHDH